MAIDPRQLRPTGLVRLLNSTPLGEVISERQLLRHRSRAGFRIGDGRRIDLFRYVAWLVQERSTAMTSGGYHSDVAPVKKPVKKQAPVAKPKSPRTVQRQGR